MVTSQAIAYLRVSTEDQRLGPQAQANAIEQFAHSHNIHLLASYLDQGVSGATPPHQRPALMQALEHLRTLNRKPPGKQAADSTHIKADPEIRVGKVFFIVQKRDRLARDSFIASTIERAIPRHITIVSADGSGNGSSPSDALMRTMLDGMAQYERSLIRQRTSDALQAKRRNGFRAGNVPFGYQADPLGKLSPHDDEQATIARIRALISEGFGQRAIVRYLATEKRLSRQGTPLGLSQVQRILRAS